MDSLQVTLTSTVFRRLLLASVSVALTVTFHMRQCTADIVTHVDAPDWGLSSVESTGHPDWQSAGPLLRLWASTVWGEVKGFRRQ